MLFGKRLITEKVRKLIRSGRISGFNSPGYPTIQPVYDEVRRKLVRFVLATE
jgi:hypothetical protein